MASCRRLQNRQTPNSIALPLAEQIHQSMPAADQAAQSHHRRPFTYVSERMAQVVAQSDKQTQHEFQHRWTRRFEKLVAVIDQKTGISVNRMERHVAVMRPQDLQG